MFSEDVVIDIHNLDSECVEYPGLIDIWGGIVAKAEFQNDAAKANLKVAESEIDLSLRKMSTEEIKKVFGLSSTSEQTYKSLVAVSQKVKDATSASIEAKHRLNVARAAYESVEKKGARLDNLVKLHGQGYFSSIQGKETKAVVLQRLKEKYAQALVAAGLQEQKPGPCVSKRKTPKK